MPRNNSALQKFKVDTPASLARKEEMELVSNEFNDARKQVIRREFDQTGLYNELFDRNRLKLGDTTIEFQLNGLLQKYLQSINASGLKLDEKMDMKSDDVTGAYTALVNGIKAYVDSQKKTNPASSIDVSPWFQGIQQSAIPLDALLNKALAQVATKSVKTDYGTIRFRNPPLTVKGVSDKALVDDTSLINLYLLLQQVQSGYNVHQGEAFKGYSSLNVSEKKKYDNILRNLKIDGINRINPVLPVRIIDPLRNLKKQGVVTDPEVLNAVIEELENAKQEDIRQQVGLNQNIEGDFRPFERQQIQEITDRYDIAIETVKRNFENGDKLGKDLKLNLPRRIFTTKPDQPNYATEGSGISATLCGCGKARGGQAGFSLDKTTRIAEQWPGYPYFVPPNNPVVNMVNPRGRVHIPTEGNGKAQGGFLPLLARVIGNKLLKSVGKKAVEKKAVKKVAENVVENEGGFLPLLAARVIGKKLLKSVGKKAVENVVEKTGDGKKKAKKAGKPKYDVI
jgi:hypothetical protein